MERKRRWVVLVGGVVLALAISRPAAGLLTDMAGHWSASLVAALAASRIVSGNEQGRFEPDVPLTRAQLSKLLVTSLGHQEDAQLLTGFGSRFADIPNWHWAKGYVESLSELAVVEGYPDGRFGPEETVTRAQLAVILVRVAGMSGQARTMRFEATAYRDDAAIPDWARGHVHVARATGLMAGFEDGEFRPLQPVTRAEGSVALFRLLDMRGRMFHLTGTLSGFDPTSRRGTVRDEFGKELAFTMSGDAQYYRGGAPSAVTQVKVLDQVWIVLGPDGVGTYMDARFQDLVGSDLKTSGRVATVTVRNETKSYTVQPGALAFLNGKPSTLDGVNGARVAYLMLDRVTGQVRVLDAVTASVQGKVVGVNPAQPTLHVQTADQRMSSLRIDTDASIVLDGAKVAFTNLQIGDQVYVTVNEAGAAIYVFAER